jgi:hypothetical protein
MRGTDDVFQKSRQRHDTSDFRGLHAVDDEVVRINWIGGYWRKNS